MCVCVYDTLELKFLCAGAANRSPENCRPGFALVIGGGLLLIGLELVGTWSDPLGCLELA